MRSYRFKLTYKTAPVNQSTIIIVCAFRKTLSARHALIKHIRTHLLHIVICMHHARTSLIPQGHSKAHKTSFSILHFICAIALLFRTHRIYTLWGDDVFRIRARHIESALNFTYIHAPRAPHRLKKIMPNVCATAAPRRAQNLRSDQLIKFKYIIKMLRIYLFNAHKHPQFCVRIINLWCGCTFK